MYILLIISVIVCITIIICALINAVIEDAEAIVYIFEHFVSYIRERKSDKKALIYKQGKLNGVSVMADALNIYCLDNGILLSSKEIETIEELICKSIETHKPIELEDVLKEIGYAQD